MSDTSEAKSPAEEGSQPSAPASFPPERELGSPPGPSEERPGPRQPRWYLHPALYVALFALVLGGWNAWQTRVQMNEMRRDLAVRLADTDAALGEARVSAQRAEAAVRDLAAKLTAVEARLAESRSQQEALEALYQELSRGRDETALAEVEQLLLIANQQLTLAGNVKTALIALRNAEAKLARLDRPQFGALKRSIASAIERLEGLPIMDVDTLSQRLESLIRRVEELPLAAHARPIPQPTAQPEPTGKPWLDFLRLAWHDLKSLVRVEKLEEPAAPLLTPEQAFFLRENVKLRLLSARLALLGRDEVSYRADLAAAGELLQRHFDTRARSTAEALAEAADLAQAPLSAPLPDVSAALEALRHARLATDRGTR
ncbi:MAG: uroporphyrinogen-III C-methyltransferase [Pseudomonadota bacterium]